MRVCAIIVHRCCFFAPSVCHITQRCLSECSAAGGGDIRHYISCPLASAHIVGNPLRIPLLADVPLQESELATELSTLPRLIGGLRPGTARTKRLALNFGCGPAPAELPPRCGGIIFPLLNLALFLRFGVPCRGSPAERFHSGLGDPT